MYYHRGVQIRYRVVSLSLLVRPLVIEVTIILLSTLLLFESLHDSRPMLGAGSSPGVELLQVFMGKRLWQDGADQQVFHGLFITTFARCLSILIESPFLHKGFASYTVPVRRRFRLDQVGHVSLEPGGSDSLGLNESLCDVVWRWLDHRVSLRVRALPSRG